MYKFITALLLISNACMAQPNMPVDSNGKIVYTGIVQCDSTQSKDILYESALQWVAIAFKDANSVLKYSDKTAGKIIVKGAIPVQSNIIGIVTNGGQIYFTMTIEFKDSKYRYNITDMYHEGTVNVPSGGACEVMLKDPKMQLKKAYHQYLQQADNRIIVLLAELKSTLIKAKSSSGW